ncbi:Ribosome-interacting GTPase [Lachnellula hyalina]|uniref:Ribosome-interacting GTPase n=1 Tax=Lachnellula hyalina TaxID=1316788 RepID=A0A8H8R867_9HELO|nr:Ribosome-interacting GTPase [Lachnellula hyalina]TVY29356.1 Ribosome-interacting GTPase [Lachnellula hyalina]
MSTTVDKIKDIEAEMAKTQKNKATSFHLGMLKAKLAKLKRELLTPTTSGGGGGSGFDVARTGVASVGFIGFPSVGKSTLMSKLTGQHSEVAAYEFTTLTTVPGQVLVNGAKIQMLDLPGIIEGAKDGKGRGRQVIAVAKTCHLIFIVLDVNKPLTDKKAGIMLTGETQVIEAELEGFGIRINKSPPNIVFRKKDKGGVSITNTVPLSHIDHDEIKAVMNEYKISSADIAIRCDATIDDLIDVLEAKSRSYIPVIYALNKIDAISIEELDLLYRIPNACPISSEHGWNIDELLDQMWEKLNLVRVYTKPKGKLPDYTQPVVLRSTKCTVEDFCNAIHKTIVEDFRQAVVYGKSVKHQPQRVGLSHELADEDISKSLDTPTNPSFAASFLTVVSVTIIKR